MHDARRQPGQPGERCRPVEVARQRCDALATQLRNAGGRRCQRQQAHAPWQAARHSQADIAASDDQDAFAAKARRQGTEGTLD